MSHVGGLPFTSSTFSRVTGTLSRNNTVSNIQRAQASIQLLSEQISSGIRLLRPSLDPIGTNLALELENRIARNDQFQRNADDTLAHLTVSESAVGQMGDLLNRAYTLGIDQLNDPNVTGGTYESVALEIDSLLFESVSVANQAYDGNFVFGGRQTQAAPFSLLGRTVAYGGDAEENQIALSESAFAGQTLSGAGAFGAISVEMTAQADLNPVLTGATKLSALNGGRGIAPGSVVLGNGVTRVTVDVTAAEDISDLIARINADMAAAGLDIAVGINGPPNAPATADRLVVTRTGGGPLRVEDLDGGTTAADLGLLTPGTVVVPVAPVGFVGADVNPAITPRTLLSALRPGGVPLDLSGITIVNSANVPLPAPTAISFAGLTTVEELLDRINGAGVNVIAQVNADGDAIDIRSTLSGARLTIGENGGTTAAQMGILYDFARVALADLNGGLGVPDLANSPDLRIAFSPGPSFDIDIARARTVADLETLIEGASGGAVAVTINTALNRVELTGAGALAGVPLTVTNVNGSFTASELGIEATTPVVTVLGASRTFVGAQAENAFTALIRLREALRAGDFSSIQSATRMVERVRAKVEDKRGELGSRAQRIDLVKQRLESESSEVRVLLNDTVGVDMADAASRFQLEQTVLQAGLQTAAKILNVSLLDFLG